MSAPLTAERLAEIRERANSVKTWKAVFSSEPIPQIVDVDVPALLAEVDRLREDANKQAVALGEELDERDRLEGLLSQFAYAVAPVEVIGEITSANDPWANALGMVTPAAEVDRLRQAIELLGRSAQAESQDIINACRDLIRAREELADRDQTIAGLMNDVDELRAEIKVGGGSRG